jgi:hypothetical protein
MEKKEYTAKNNKLVILLLNLSLAFSVFAFSGFASVTPNHLQKTVQTEVRIPTPKKERKIACYKTQLTFLVKNYFFAFSARTLLKNYSEIIKAKGDTLCKEFASFSPGSDILLISYLPRSSNERVVNPSRG